MADDREREPPYRRIVADLTARILGGQLPPGAPVPSITRLMQETGSSRNTVIKALAVLDSEGWTATVRGWGRFVNPRDKWPKR